MLELKSTLVVLFLVTSLVNTNTASPKRGVSVTGKTYKCGDLETFNSVSWWYDWTAKERGFEKAGCNQSHFPGYVPMVAGEENIRWFNVRDDAEYILGFNEPNQADQANLSAERAAELWPQIEAKSKGKKLVGPSLAGCGNVNRCIPWYTDFFNACTNCRVDYLGAHSYSCDANGVVNALETLSTTFGKKVWLTEFACAARDTVEEQVAFLQEIMPLLEASEHIEKYAWFTNRRFRNTTFLSDIVNLLDRESPQLTAIGDFYDNY